MDIQTIDKNLLSDLHRKAVANERKRMNFDLRTSALDQSQRMLNALEPGTQVPVHRHMETAETTICIEGYLEVVLYAEASGQDETGGDTFGRDAFLIYYECGTVQVGSGQRATYFQLFPDGERLLGSYDFQFPEAT